MTEKEDQNVIDFTGEKNKRIESELRAGSRINVAHKKILGVVHTEAENSESDEWEEAIKLVVLKDVGEGGFQVTMDDIIKHDYIGSVVFSMPDADGKQTPLDIDAQCSWANIKGNQTILGFEYRNSQDEQVQRLLKTVYS